MKKETLKEVGKLLFDFTKIIFAIAIITPFFQSGRFELAVVLPMIALVAVGIYLINKGSKDE